MENTTVDYSDVSPMGLLLSPTMDASHVSFNESSTVSPVADFTSVEFTDIFTEPTGSLETLKPTGAAEDFLTLDGLQITVAVLSCIFCVVTLVGNLLVLYAFCTESRLRTYTNYYIVGLSFADLVAGAFTMPLYSVYWVLGYWPFSVALCDMYLYLNHVFIHVSLLGILVLAVDRYQAIYYPLKHLQKRTLRHASFMISISYIIPFILWLPYTLLWPYIVGERRIAPDLCHPQYIVDSLFFSILAPLLFFWIPVPIISVLYWRIYLVIKKKTSHRKGPLTMQEIDSVSTSNRVKEDNEAPDIKRSGPRPSETTMTSQIADTSFGELGFQNGGFGCDEDDIAFVSSPTLNNNQTTTSHAKWQRRGAEDITTTASLPSLQNELPILNIIETEEQGPPDATPVSRPTKRVGQESKRESNRALRTLTLIFIVLIVSTLPWSILVIIYCICRSCIPLILYQASVYVAHLNSTFNPFCYAIANPLYIQAFTKLFCRGRNIKPRED